MFYSTVILPNTSITSYKICKKKISRNKKQQLLCNMLLQHRFYFRNNFFCYFCDIAKFNHFKYVSYTLVAQHVAKSAPQIKFLLPYHKSNASYAIQRHFYCFDLIKFAQFMILFVSRCRFFLLRAFSFPINCPTRKFTYKRKANVTLILVASMLQAHNRLAVASAAYYQNVSSRAATYLWSIAASCNNQKWRGKQVAGRQVIDTVSWWRTNQAGRSAQKWPKVISCAIDG